VTATYTQPWATARDFVRFLVQDTDTSAPIWQDEELDSLLSNNGADPRMAAAEALEALAGKYARNAIMYNVGITSGFSLDRRAVPKLLMDRAKALREEALAIPFELESVVDHYVDAQGIDRSNYYNTPSSPEDPLA
jgi:hypothetical protein